MTASFGRLVGKRRAFYPVVAGIVVYTLLVGADASMMRAAIMGLLVALANYLNRRSLAILSLFVAGLVMTALNPLTLWDVGFQLSFLATLSLVLFATPMTERFERLMARLLPARAARPLTGFLNDALIVTLAAQILTLPLIAHHTCPCGGSCTGRRPGRHNPHQNGSPFAGSGQALAEAFHLRPVAVTGGGMLKTN